MKVLILIADSNGCAPVPAVKGGAVATLVEHLVEENNLKQLVDLEIVSYYDVTALEKSKCYPDIKFRWVKVPRLVSFMDKCLFKIITTFFKNKKAISYKSIFSLLFYIYQSSKILKQEKFDKVVLENNIPLAWSIKLSKYKGDFYYHLHNVPRTNAKCIDVFKFCKSFLCVSEFVAREICKETNPIGPNDIASTKVLYNCIDKKMFNVQSGRRSETRKKYNINENDFVIVFVGRMTWEKGVDKVLSTVDQLSDKNNIKVLLVGSYAHGFSLEDEYQRGVADIANRLGDIVIFTGFVSQEEVANIYSAADLAILPSMWDEPAGLTNIEAMACGLPVITTYSGGINEYVGSSAMVLQRDEYLVQNILRGINKLRENKRVREEYSSSGVKRVSILFGQERYLENFIKCIND